MSLRAIPLTVLAFILYNVIVLFSGATPTGAPVEGVASDAAAAANEVLRMTIFSFPMISGATWVFTWADLILVITFGVLFIEIVKATYTTTASMIDHALSMVVFIACLIEFLVVKQAATSTFFLLMTASLIDVVAGYTIGIRVARRDLNFGGGE